METPTMNRPIPLSQTIYRQSGDVVSHELPAAADNKVKNRKSRGFSSSCPWNQIRHIPHGRRVGSIPHSHRIWWIHHTSVLNGLAGYYALEPKTVGGFTPPNPLGPHLDVAYYRQARMPLMMNQAYELENLVVAHGCVLSIVQKPPKKMVNCCGSILRGGINLKCDLAGKVSRTAVIIFSIVAALLIIVIRLGAGLGAQAARNKKFQSMWVHIYMRIKLFHHFWHCAELIRAVL